MQTYKEWRACNPQVGLRLPAFFYEQEAERFYNFFKENEDALVVEDYLIEREVPRKTFDNWTRKSKVLMDAYKKTLMLLGARREKGMLQGKLKEKGVLWSLHQYNPRWGEANQYWSDMKKQEERQESGIKIVEVPVFGEKKDKQKSDKK